MRHFGEIHQYELRELFRVVAVCEAIASRSEGSVLQMAFGRKDIPLPQKGNYFIDQDRMIKRVIMKAYERTLVWREMDDSSAIPSRLK